MSTARFISYTQSGPDRREISRSNDQNLALGLAMLATKQAGAAQPGLAHSAVLYDNYAGAMLVTVNLKPAA